MFEEKERAWGFYLDDDTIWNIVREDVPELLNVLRSIRT